MYLLFAENIQYNYGCTMYTEAIKRTDEQAVTKPDAVAWGVIYVDPRTTVNEQRCVGKYFYMCKT